MRDDAPEHDFKRLLPVPVTKASARPSLARSDAQAAFVSQLLAARSRLESQRARRRAPVAAAIGAYDAGGKIAVRRLPQGYRKTVVA